MKNLINYTATGIIVLSSMIYGCNSQNKMPVSGPVLDNTKYQIIENKDIPILDGLEGIALSDEEMSRVQQK